MELMTIELDRLHLALLARLQLFWNDDTGYGGAPAVDPKRPYGNSDVLGDLREIYAKVEGYEFLTNEHGESSFVQRDGLVYDAEEANEYLWRHDRELVSVLEILTGHPGGISEGTYRKLDIYGRDWERVSA